MKDFFNYNAKIEVKGKEYSLSRNRLMVILAKSPAWLDKNQPPEKLCIKVFEKIETVHGEELLINDSRLLTAKILDISEDQLADILRTYDDQEEDRRKAKKQAEREEKMKWHRENNTDYYRSTQEYRDRSDKGGIPGQAKRPRKPAPAIRPQVVTPVPAVEEPVIKHPAPANIEEAYARWKAMERKSILLDSQFAIDDQINVGETKIGGKADMPVGSLYPLGSNGLAMSLVAQINLAEVHALINNVFPVDKGMLSFFALTEEDNYHMEKKKYAVRYFADISGLQRMDYPKGDIHPHDSMQCTMTLSATIPFDGWPEVEPVLPMAQKDDDKFDELMDNYSTCRKSNILGYCQDDIMIETKLAEGEDFSLENIIPLFHLDRQYDREKKLDAGYGDGGTLGFYIRKKDLQEMRFDNVIVEFHSS